MSVMSEKVFGLSREDYQAWRHEAVTKLVLKFLHDKREFIKATALAQWVDGSKSFGECNDTVRGQIIEIQELLELPFEAIAEFYKSKEEENGAELTSSVNSPG